MTQKYHIAVMPNWPVQPQLTLCGRRAWPERTKVTLSDVPPAWACWTCRTAENRRKSP